MAPLGAIRYRQGINAKSLRRLQDIFVASFIALFNKPPTQITLDIDPFDDPTHGQVNAKCVTPGRLSAWKRGPCVRSVCNTPLHATNLARTLQPDDAMNNLG